MNPVWFSPIKISRTRFILSDIHVDANLYTTFKSEIGGQLDKKKKGLGLSPLGIHVINPSFWVMDNSPLEKA